MIIDLHYKTASKEKGYKQQLNNNIAYKHNNFVNQSVTYSTFVEA